MRLLFGYVTLEVRHVFQGEHIAIWQSASAPEVWAYSVAWLALGLVFLGYGIVRGSREARLASAALVVLSVVKVFLYDLTGITGLWRALSVICLGAVLIGIGLVYQKLIFAGRLALRAPATLPQSCNSVAATGSPRKVGPSNNGRIVHRRPQVGSPSNWGW